MHNVELELANLNAQFTSLIKNTDNLPELFKLLAVTAERTSANARDISAVSKKTSVLEIAFPREIQKANDRANTTSRWVFGISILISTSLFGYVALDVDANRAYDVSTRDDVATHEKRISKIEARYNVLGVDLYD